MKTLTQLRAQLKAPLAADANTTNSILPPGGDATKDFINKHVVAVQPDANGNCDKTFQAANIRAYDRSASKHGYNTGEDARVYEQQETPPMKPLTAFLTPGAALNEGDVAHAQFERYHAASVKMLSDIHKAMEMHRSNVMSGSNKDGSMTHWGHVGDVRRHHSQLEDIHNSLMQTGEYARPLKEDTEINFEGFDEPAQATLKTILESLNDTNRSVMARMINEKDYDRLNALLDQLEEDQDA